MFRSLTLILVLAGSAACASSPPLAHAYPTPDALAREVLAALGRGDEARLAMLALSEEEFRAHVWPRLPASRRERNLPFSYVWADLQQKSATSLTRMIARYRSRSFDLEHVRFSGQTTGYGSFEVHRGSIFHVREGGQPLIIRACGSLVVKNGQWKVFSYIVDE